MTKHPPCTTTSANLSRRSDGRQAAQAALALATVMGLAPTSVARGLDASLIWQAYVGGVTRASVTCTPGAPDCNPCAVTIPEQMEDALGLGMIAWSTRAWAATGTDYAPSGLDPAEVYDEGGAAAFFGLPLHHVQGFARTNSDAYPYVLTHSDDEHGSLSIFGGTPEQPVLAAIHRTDRDHPSGVSVIGHHAVFAGDRNQFQVVDLTAPQSADASSSYPFPRDAPSGRGLATAGGGIGVVRLAGGAYLVLVTDGGAVGRSRFFRIDGPLNAPHAVRFLNEVDYTQPASWNGDYIGSENLTLIPECGTGDIYAVHTGSLEQDGLRSLWGDGHWRLSRVEWDGDVPRLRTLNAWRKGQDVDECWLRGAATVHVDPTDGRLGFLCHARNAEGGVGVFSGAFRHGRAYGE